MYRIAALAAVLVGAGTADAQTPSIPPGYSATVFFQDNSAGPLTGLALDEQGRLYSVTQFGTIRRHIDADGDGVAEIAETVYDGAGLQASVTGILFGKGKLVVSHLGRVSRLVDADFDGVYDFSAPLITGLPFGWHQNNDLFTDGDLIYFGLGSTTDFSAETDPISATLMVYDPVTKSLDVAAEGLRNTFDGAVHPVTGDIIVGDNGPNTVQQLPNPADEINLIRGRKHYGHPFNWGATPRGSGYQGPLVLVPPHASPCGMAFNENVGMSGHRNEVVVATLGSGQSGIAKLPILYSDGGAVRSYYSSFITGLDTAIDVVFDDTGAMYVAEFNPGRIYRIDQTGETRVVIEGLPGIGRSCAISIHATPYAGFFTYPAASSGLAPVPINLGVPGLDVHLDTLSPLFAFSTFKPSAIFDFPQPTILDASGAAQVKINIPNDTDLVGVVIHLQVSVWDPLSGLPVDVSPPQPLKILAPF